ncbi:beta-ketoacyl synthase N-terminal-like domain-containing protein [Gynuella sunshinyii]|uniref:3-oxoacyl-(Acyl-carrier-protein) synthase n=1 Tax=Gynuella sunshinyii YC6258 TaxID=1445510 RepID=A0A0C5VR07_9GAMM|nr:beta-ketoacyl synthase N-terminal-like domain-containing protein [Gynuella sunshinyii]AJQ97062.1 3-oxoacyl-(acyl-carrier-protein) synthase [Gynuella sunshinyii YC6258]
MPSNNIAIVAASAFTPYGMTTDDFIEGINGRPVQFDNNSELAEYISEASVQVALTPEYDARKVLNARGINHLDRLTRHVCVAAQQLHASLVDDGMDQWPVQIAADRLSIVLGTTGPVQSVVDFDMAAIEEPQYVSSGLFPNIVFNVPACYASIRHGAKASVISFNDGETASANAFKTAIGQLQNNRADMVWVGGAEALTPAHVLLIGSQSNYQAGQPLPAMTEGAYLLAAVKYDMAVQNAMPVLAELECAVSLFCPDPEKALVALLARMCAERPVEMQEISWLVGETSGVDGILGYALKTLDIQQPLGYLASATTAASVMTVLCHRQVLAGERVLHICRDENGAWAAVLLRKNRDLC